MKPISGGRPAIDAAAKVATTAMTGQRRPSPVSARRSRVWHWWSTMPTTRNSADLNRAWAISSTQPAKASSDGAGAEQHHQEPELADRPVGEEQLQVVLAHRPVARRAAGWRSPTPSTIHRHGPTTANAGAKRATR